MLHDDDSGDDDDGGDIYIIKPTCTDGRSYSEYNIPPPASDIHSGK